MMEAHRETCEGLRSFSPRQRRFRSFPSAALISGIKWVLFCMSFSQRIKAAEGSITHPAPLQRQSASASEGVKPDDESREELPKQVLKVVAMLAASCLLSAGPAAAARRERARGPHAALCLSAASGKHERCCPPLSCPSGHQPALCMPGGASRPLAGAPAAWLGRLQQQVAGARLGLGARQGGVAHSHT